MPEIQSVAKLLGHSPFEVGFLTEFEKLPPPPQNNVANSEHTFSLSISILIGGRGEFYFEVFSGILTVMLSF